MSNAAPIFPPSVNQELVLEKCEYFVNVQLWPLRQQLNPLQWLDNFAQDELDHAVHLLNAFLYYSRSFVDQLFLAAFQSLSREVKCAGEPRISAEARWRAFVDRVLVTYVTGEVPSPTDSGYLFARKARQILQIDDSRIMHPEDALEFAISQRRRPVVFVDDFVGTGNQCIATWKREYLMGRVAGSFAKLATAGGGSFYYCPLLCTTTGARRINETCKGLRVCPAHLLPGRYSAISSESAVWPERLQSTAVDFLRVASKRAGIPDTSGQKGDWRGFGHLGLCLAFEHSVPDATLPIFYWEKNGWKPLVRRT